MKRLITSPAFVSLENQVTFLRDLEVRLKKAKWKSPEDLQRVERLPVLSRAVDDAAELETEVSDIETRVLSSLYHKERGTGNVWRAWSVGNVPKARGKRRESSPRSRPGWRTQAGLLASFCSPARPGWER